MRDFTKITEGNILRYTLKKITGSNVSLQSITEYLNFDKLKSRALTTKSDKTKLLCSHTLQGCIQTYGNAWL